MTQEQIVTKIVDHDTSIHTIVRVQDKLGGAVDRLNDTAQEIKHTLKELQQEQKRILEIEQKILGFSEVKDNVLKRLDAIENRQATSGCHSLIDLSKRLQALEDGRNKIIWGILTAVGMAMLGLVLKIN